MKIRISNAQKAAVSIKEIRQLVKYVLWHEGISKKDLEISVLLADNKKIRKINKEYLGRSGATDVLSFCMWEGLYYGMRPELLGDVVVSVEQAKLAAKKLNKNYKDELFLYIIHGMLHLLGFVDNTEKNAKRMHSREGEILKKWLKLL